MGGRCSSIGSRPVTPAMARPDCGIELPPVPAAGPALLGNGPDWAPGLLLGTSIHYRRWTMRRSGSAFSMNAANVACPLCRSLTTAGMRHSLPASPCQVAPAGCAWSTSASCSCCSTPMQGHRRSTAIRPSSRGGLPVVAPRGSVRHMFSGWAKSRWRAKHVSMHRGTKLEHFRFAHRANGHCLGPDLSNCGEQNERRGRRGRPG